MPDDQMLSHSNMQADVLQSVELSFAGRLNATGSERTTFFEAIISDPCPFVVETGTGQFSEAVSKVPQYATAALLGLFPLPSNDAVLGLQLLAVATNVTHRPPVDLPHSVKYCSKLPPSFWLHILASTP